MTLSFDQIIDITLILLLLTAFAATINKHKFGSKKINQLSIFFWTLLLFDVSGRVLLQMDRSNIWLFNILTIVEFNFLIYFLTHHLKSHFTYLQIVFLSIFNFTFLSELILSGGLIKVNLELSLITGSLMVIILIVLYLRNLLNQNAMIKLSDHLLFWLCTGWLFQYLVNLPGRLIIDQISDPAFHKAVSLVLFVSNLACYMLIITGFQWANQK